MKRLVYLLIPLLLVSCSDFFGTSTKKGVTVRFRCGVDEQTKVNQVALSEVATKLHVMVFDDYGNKCLSKIITQTSDNPDFGEVTFTVNETGHYTAVAVAHSGPANASIESLSKVSFTVKDGLKNTDTFIKASDFNVNLDEGDIETPAALLHRKSAMVRFIFSDTDFPDELVKFRFKYTGGSANVNPTTGEGCTKSTQTEVRLRNDSNIYEIYTFPYNSDKGNLSVTIEGVSASDAILKTVTIEKVYVEAEYISEYTGSLMIPNTPSNGVGIVFMADSEWKGTYTYTF